jgi:hypothetical protein
MDKEIWKDIPEYEGLYQVSNLGRVKSLGRVRSNGSTYREFIMSFSMRKTEKYHSVRLSDRHGKRKVKRVHQLIAMAFLNHKPNGLNLVVDHIDNDPLNNHLDNLQLISHRKNSSKDKSPKSGFTGVIKVGKRFQARFRPKGKPPKYIGTYDTAEEASEAYQEKLKEFC